MSSIAGIGGYATSIYQTRSASSAVTNTAAADDTRATATPSNPSVSPFVFQIAGDRLNGALTGDITPTYFQHLASQASELGQAIDPNILSAGLQYLGSQNTAKQQNGSPSAA